MAEEPNGGIRRELDRIQERLDKLDERIQQTRDAQGEQRGKLAIIMILVSAIVSAAVQMFTGSK